MGPHSSTPSDNAPVVRERSTYLNDSQAATLCTLFGDGLESGMGYARIIDMLERQGHERKVVSRLRESILQDGDMLGEAFARFGLLDPTARKLIYVAEQQGKLPTTFKQLGKFYAKRHRHKKRLTSACVEPFILFALGFVLARNIFSTDFDALTESSNVIANLKPIFIQSSIEVGIFGCICFFLGLIYLNLPVDMAMRNVIHRLWVGLPLPVINESAKINSVAVFCRYTEQSIASGLTVHRALSLAAEAANNPKIERRIPIVQRAIENGERLSTGLYESKALPQEVVEYIDVGEESGRLEERLRDLADRYDARAEETFERTMTGFLYTMRMIVVVTVVIALLLTLSDLLTGIDMDTGETQRQPEPPPENPPPPPPSSR